MAMVLALIHFLEGSNDLLKPDASLLVVLVVFACLIFVLNAIIFKPITKVLDERDRLTSGAMDEAKQAGHRYEQQLSEYEEKIRAARAESYKMLEAQRKQAMAERGEKLAQVKKQVTEQVDASKRELEQAGQAAKGQLESDARAMAETISRNLLKRPLGGTTS